MLTLRPYQQAAIASIYGYFEKESGNPLVVIPTAGGKSLVMAAFIDGVLKAWPDQRVLVVTHVRELIAQNHAEMLGLWPKAPAGIYSAGLGRRDARARILFAGIQSIHDKATRIGHADLVLIDEAHLIPGRSNTMYRRFLNDLQAINPALKVIGLTATPFRLDSGMLHEGENALFTDIAYEVSVRDLIDQGYLSPLISKQTKTRLDVTGVGSRCGEFIARDLEDAVDQDAITRAAVAEVIAHGDPFRVEGETAAIGDLQREPPAAFLVAAEGDVGDADPLRLAGGQHLQRRGGRLELHLAAGELEAAVGAFERGDGHNGPAFRADLRGRGAVARTARPLRPHQIDGAMPADVAREIENEAVLLALGEPRAPTGHLDI